MSPSYKTNALAGWCGDPKRGAAMGRDPTLGPPSFDGRLTLRRVRLNRGGYDSMGTYFGRGLPLYWYASDDGTIDAVLRARSRPAAKVAIRVTYPNARFLR